MPLGSIFDEIFSIHPIDKKFAFMQVLDAEARFHVPAPPQGYKMIDNAEKVFMSRQKVSVCK